MWKVTVKFALGGSYVFDIAKDQLQLQLSRIESDCVFFGNAIKSVSLKGVTK